MGIQVTLRDGTPAWVLPLRREDKPLLVAGFDELSEETRRMRFLTPVARLSDSMLNHLVDDVDGVDHVAYALAAETEPGVFDPVAIGRMVRYEDEPDAADVAVTVKDAWQGRGIASALLKVLVDNRPEGVVRIVTEVVMGNEASLAMLRRLGPTEVQGNGYGAYDVEIALAAADGDVAETVGDAESPVVPDVVPPQVPVVRVRSEAERRRPRIDRDRRRKLQTRDAVCPWLTPAD